MPFRDAGNCTIRIRTSGHPRLLLGTDSNLSVDNLEFQGGKLILSMVMNTNKKAIEQIKEIPLYKNIIKIIPELLASGYFLLVFFTFLSHQEGIKELISFLQKIGFKSLADSLNGVVQHIDGYRGIGLFVVIIFVFVASLNSYILWYKHEIRRVEDDLYIQVPGSAYFMVLAIAALWDYFKWVSIPWYIWLPCVAFLIVSVAINIKCVNNDLISLEKFKKIWEERGEDSSYRWFCVISFIAPIALSIFTLPLILLYVLLGNIKYPKKDGVIFNDNSKLSLEKEEEKINQRKSIRDNFYNSLSYTKRYREIMEFVDKKSGGNYVVLPILPEETAAGIRARIQNVAKENPAVLVFSNGKQIVDVQVVNIPIESQSQGES